MATAAAFFGPSRAGMTVHDETEHEPSRAWAVARRLAPPAAITVLAWAIVGVFAVGGVIVPGPIDFLDGAGRALLVGVGAISIVRWRVLGERTQLGTGAALMTAGFVLPGRLLADVSPRALAGAGAVLALAAVARFARPSPTSEPFALFLAALGQAAWSEAFVPGAASLFIVIGLLFAVDGLSRGIRGAFRQQGNELAVARADEAAARAAREEREHDVRSALMAIDGAARTLERYHDRLDDDSRSMLANALSSEVSRLQKLIVEAPSEGAEPFSLAATVEPVVALAHTAGQEIRLIAPHSLRAVGRPEHTAQIVRTLLDNARLHAPDSVVRVVLEPRGEFVLVKVEDNGPGVPADEQEAIFQRGRRGRNAAPDTGQGLGLSTASRLAAAQGGALWVEDRKGGGASFVLRLQRAGQ